jgi:hypothetical protein
MGTLKNECNAKAYNHERTNKRITKFMYTYVNFVFAKINPLHCIVFSP